MLELYLGKSLWPILKDGYDPINTKVLWSIRQHPNAVSARLEAA